MGDDTFACRTPERKNASVIASVNQRFVLHGWRGVATQRHLNEGAAGQAAYHQAKMPEVKRASTRSHEWQHLDGNPLTTIVFGRIAFTKFVLTSKIYDLH